MKRNSFVFAKNNIRGLHIYYTVYIFLAISIFSFCSCSGPEVKITDYILIYNGVSADPDGVDAVAKIADDLGYDVKYISRLKNLPENLEEAAAFVIGGTDDDTGAILENLYNYEDELKAYIENGGKYLGICGGAYIASKGSNWPDGYEDGISLVDVESFAFDPNYQDPQIITVTWLDKSQNIYYQYGPAFAKKDLPAETEILAYYNTEKVAAFLLESGDGKVVLCGPHPEADETWTEEYDGSLIKNHEQWQDTHDICIDMFERLLAN